MRVSFLTALAAGVLLAAVPAMADRLELFDAHMHYNQEPTPFYELDRLVTTFRENGVTGVLSTSRPNKGTHQLMAAKPAGLWVVPFIRPYRVRSDIQTWFNDPATLDLIESEYRRGYYRGIGEFHLHGRSAETAIVKKTVDFAVEHNLYLHCHCDEPALLALYRHNAKTRVIWAHTGFSVAPDRIAELLEAHPDALWGELSYHSGITGTGGTLTPAWKALFARHADRFLLGSDTWINERWIGYATIMKEYRGWLAQLPPDQAQRIAMGNAVTLFGPRRSD
jgi:hypothetical protein